jgi:enoyl-[acyl-carrier protein] reductase I
MAEGILAGKRGVIMGVANDKSIAWACAQACAEAGAELAYNYLGPMEKRVRKLAGTLPGSPLILPCDVSKDEEVASFFAAIGEQWDSLDFVIHSMAFAERDDLKNPFVETPRKNFALALDISAYSLVAVAREAAPLMSNGGSIVAMSYYGAEKVIPHYNVMGVAKAALEASARYLAYDLGPKGIRVNCVSAGALRTLSSSAISGMKTMLSASETVNPLGRNIHAGEVASSTVYLLSDLSSGVTGETHHVDCGYHAMGMHFDLGEKA